MQPAVVRQTEEGSVESVGLSPRSVLDHSSCGCQPKGRDSGEDERGQSGERQGTSAKGSNSHMGLSDEPARAREGVLVSERERGRGKSRLPWIEPAAHSAPNSNRSPQLKITHYSITLPLWIKEWKIRKQSNMLLRFPGHPL
ncbi:hypothetical protein JZ751_020700 [Albula glossodonta]|uniref:Uncharacterized protein n=1 Tax=Albula glossodonta TaxID=121402 RepID=A0A8T2PNQ8_9TELE|nr:hypothetical protein JZ751_020700 [Albula glossodonta]